MTVGRKREMLPVPVPALSRVSRVLLCEVEQNLPCLFTRICNTPGRYITLYYPVLPWDSVCSSSPSDASLMSPSMCLASLLIRALLQCQNARTIWRGSVWSQRGLTCHSQHYSLSNLSTCILDPQTYPWPVTERLHHLEFISYEWTLRISTLGQPSLGIEIIRKMEVRG